MISGLLLVAYCLLIVFGVKIFTMGAQERVLLGVDPLYLLKHLHIHALRYLLVWPVVKLGEWTHADIDLLFSFYVMFIACVMIHLLSRTLQCLLPAGLAKNTAWYDVGFLALWLVILWFMNGRLICGFFGMSAILYYQAAFLSTYSKKAAMPYHLLVFQFVGLFFSSVSTGTFSVAYSAIAMFFISVTIISYMKAKVFPKRFAITNIIVLLVFLPFEAHFIVKNACFFSDEIANLPLCQSIMVPPDVESGAIPADLDYASYIAHLPKRKDDDKKVVSYADALTEYEGYNTTSEKALRHSPINVLIVLGVNMTVGVIILWVVFAAGWLAALLSYFYKSAFSPRTPLIASLGIATSIGLFGIKSILMMLPPLMLLGAYYLALRLRPAGGVQ
jgi:hypothetical protein